MNEITAKYFDVIQRASNSIYVMYDGEKLSLSKLKEEADSVLPKTLRNPNAKTLPDYPAILQAVIDAYAEAFGIETYAPTTIAKDKTSRFWLHKIKSKIFHPFFDRYKLYLSKDGFSQKAIKNIELSCEEVLSYCANPKNPSGLEKKRGLVIGDVQSGKTANYLGLVNMAYDYGYRIVVLLAGSTDYLRLQTQKRTDSGVIGAKSQTIGNTIEYIGVGDGLNDHFVVPYTNQKSDFSAFIQKNKNLTIGDLKKPVVLVVKKNSSVLKSVGERLQSELMAKGLDSKSILIIDDEADYASVDTSPTETPSTINGLVREIFNKFPIASYVGYTATPFANVFIDPFDDDIENLDLFPSDFITQLHAPSNYFGGRKVFPKGEIPRSLRLICEEEPLFLPVIHDKNISYPGLPQSLKEAIHCFLIDNVVRSLRGQLTKHRSMMINITRFNSVQKQIWNHVKEYIKALTDIIEEAGCKTKDEFVAYEATKNIYDLFMKSKFYEIVRNGNSEDSMGPVSWEQVQRGLYDEIKQINVVVINSTNGKMTSPDKGKRFDYDDYETVGARVIAIGGMVLSRGLTLEGLMVSYYSRNAGAYDTLLQMCRWFGYRPKYEDLCRVYLTQDNVDRFDVALDAIEDFKMQLEDMKLNDKTPKDYGLMIKQSPETLETTLLITSRNKLRGTEEIQLRLNYGGVYADTSKLPRRADVNKYNLKKFQQFSKKLKNRFGWNDNFYMASGIEKFAIADLIKELKISYVNKKFDTKTLSEYIEKSEMFELWDVVIETGDKKTKDSMKYDFEGEKLVCVHRSFSINNKEDEFIRLGGTNNRVIDPGVFNAGLWLSEAASQAILEEKKRNDPKHGEYKTLSATDYLKKRERPILVIYPIELKTECNDKEKEEWGDLIDDLRIIKDNIKKQLSNGENEPLLAFGIGFPKKENPVAVSYRANQIKLAQLRAGIEPDYDDVDGDINDD